MGTHLRGLLLRENGDFHGRVLARIGGLYKTQIARCSHIWYNLENRKEAVYVMSQKFLKAEGKGYDKG